MRNVIFFLLTTGVLGALLGESSADRPCQAEHGTHSSQHCSKCRGHSAADGGACCAECADVQHATIMRSRNACELPTGIQHVLLRWSATCALQRRETGHCVLQHDVLATTTLGQASHQALELLNQTAGHGYRV